MSSKNNKFYRFCKRIFNLIFKRYYNVQIIGKEPKDEPIIIAGNHKNLILLSVVSQLGDFAASYIKRYVDIKDYGKMIPGHGGVLDRIDSMMYIAPFAYIMLKIL